MEGEKNKQKKRRQTENGCKFLFRLSELESAYSLLDIEENIDEDLFVDCHWDELDSQESFSCTICDKILKTKRGLERHEENHREKRSVELMDNTSWQNLIKAAVDKLIIEDLQSDEILEELKYFTLSQMIIVCHYSRHVLFLMSLPWKIFYQMFCKVVSQMDSIHGLSKKTTVVVGFELANHVIAYYKNLGKVQQLTSSSASVITLK